MMASGKAGLLPKLSTEFNRMFPAMAPAFAVRVPGRVNLIGEHTDYNGLPVMPMAIAREVRMIVAPHPGSQVIVHNKAPQFGVREFTVADRIPPYETGDWGNYVKAGVQGVCDIVAGKGGDVSQLRGFTALFDSDLPMAAGLSSSSAVVVAAALAFMACNDIVLDRAVLAEQMAVAERYVGTMGGGMDQAVELLARAGAAIKIDFFPVRTTPVDLPGDYTVVIANSLVVAPKTATARLHYNRRPIECRLAAALLAHHLDGRNGAPRNVQRVSELLPFVPAQELLAVAQSLFTGVKWSKERAASVLGIDLASLENQFFRMSDGQILPEFPDGLPLMDRMQHVLTEGERVEAAVAALRKGDAAAFGALMNASHASCRDQYGISCPELEALTTIAREEGAVGARLTGAGFGGCVVGLVRNAQVDAFRAGVIKRYYDEYLRSKRPELHDAVQKHCCDNLVIVSAPCQGAEVVSL